MVRQKGPLLSDALAVAVEALSWISYAGLGERTALFKAAKQLDISDRKTLRHAHRLVMEVTRFRNQLDYFVSESLQEVPLEKVPHGIASFLRILTFLSRIDVTKESELGSVVRGGRFILGWREMRPYEYAVAHILSKRPIDVQDGDEVERIALLTCNPEWLVRRMFDVFGREFSLQLLKRNLRSLPTYVRLNHLKEGDANEVVELSKLLQSSVKCSLADVWKIRDSSELAKLSSAVSEGRIVVQDFASILASVIASPKPGDIVFDVCAAPGNKTTHLACLMDNLGQIYSIDNSITRLTRLRMELNRTNTKIATPILADGSSFPIMAMADVVLVDPPCTNTGVYARSPGVKWRVGETVLKSLVQRQCSILENASSHVRPGGTVVYCTCSILPDENEFVIERFMRRNPNFELSKQNPFLGVEGMRGFGRCQRFYPHMHDCNGYFIAKLVRLGA
jgi:16S rRNA (cytosine967-C5)-methyltransferase